MDKIDVPIKKLESPPKSREETEIIREIGSWRALAIPLFGVSTAVGLYMKLKKPWLVNPIITGNKFVSLGSLSGISYMEFYYENKLLSEALPEGFYKNMYSSFTPTKLTLSPQEVKQYWDENPKEFHWRFNRNALDPKSDEQSRLISKLFEEMEEVTLRVKKQENPIWKELLDFINEKEPK